MGKVEKISVALTPELSMVIRDAVASGDYASASEIIREALRAWREAREEKSFVTEIRALIAEAEASGYMDGPPDFEAIKAKGRQILADRRG